MTAYRIYARQSANGIAGTDTDSITNQVARCREYAQAQHYVLAKNDDGRPAIYTDPEVTGGCDSGDPVEYFTSHAGLWAAMSDIRSGEVLIVRWRDRLARSVVIQEHVRHWCASRGARDEAADEPNGQMPADVAFRQIRAVFSELRRIEICTATKMGMLRNQAAGKRQGRLEYEPFGYKSDPYDRQNMIINHEEQVTLAEIRRLAGLGLKPYAICTRLDALGHRRRGKPWRGGEETVRRILRRDGLLPLVQHRPGWTKKNRNNKKKKKETLPCKTLITPTDEKN